MNKSVIASILIKLSTRKVKEVALAVTHNLLSQKHKAKSSFCNISKEEVEVFYKKLVFLS